MTRAIGRCEVTAEIFNGLGFAFVVNTDAVLVVVLSFAFAITRR